MGAPRDAEQSAVEALLDAGSEFLVEDPDGEHEYRFKVAEGGSHAALMTPKGWVVMPFEIVATMARECVAERVKERVEH